MSTHDDLDFLDDNNEGVDTHDLAQEYLSAKQGGGASRWVVPLLLILGVSAAGAGAWVFYLRDLLFPAMPLSADSAMGVPTNNMAPVANTDTALPPSVAMAPTPAVPNVTNNSTPNVAPSPIAATADTAMGVPPVAATAPAEATPPANAAVTTPTPQPPAIPTPATETDANFAPPLSDEKPVANVEAPKVESAAPTTTAEPKDANAKAENASTVTSEELVTPAMPTPTALPTSEVKPLAEQNTAPATEKPVAETTPLAPSLPDNTTETTTKAKEEPTTQQAEILLLRDQMRALTEAVDQVKTAKTTAPAETTTAANTNQFAAKEAVDKLNQQLAELTTKLDTINQRTESLMQTAQNNTVATTDAAPSPAAATKTADQPKAEATPKTIAKPQPKAVSKPAPRVVAKKPVVPVVRKATWQLRSASPGVAGLAKNGGSEIQTFVVGDTVPGLGRVTTVQPDASGQWVVTTTGGTLRQ